MQLMFTYDEIEALYGEATPPRAGSTTWYDACDLLATAVKDRLRSRFGRGFQVEVYGDEVAVILRIRGDGYGAAPWSVDRALDAGAPMGPQVDEALAAVQRHVDETYV